MWQKIPGSPHLDNFNVCILECGSLGTRHVSYLPYLALFTGLHIDFILQRWRKPQWKLGTRLCMPQITKKKMHDFRKSFPMTNVTTSFNIQIHTQSQWRHCCCNIQEPLFNCQLIQIRYLPLLVGKELHSISNVCTQLGHFTRKIMAPCLHREHKATERMPPNRIFLGSWVFQVM